MSHEYGMWNYGWMIIGTFHSGLRLLSHQSVTFTLWNGGTLYIASV